MPATAAVKHRRHEPVDFTAHSEVAARARYAGARRHMPPATVEPSHDETEQFLRRILEDGPAPLSAEEVVAEASRARRRARARHRPFRLSKTQWIIAITLMGQLTGVLWWQSQALSLRNKDQRLKDEIGKMSQQIAQTKNAIAQLDSEANLSQLAAQMQWQRAPVNNFDNVTKVQRLTPQEVAALGAVATSDGSEAASAPEPADVPRPAVATSAISAAPRNEVLPSEVVASGDGVRTPSTPGIAPLPEIAPVPENATRTAEPDLRTGEGH